MTVDIAKLRALASYFNVYSDEFDARKLAAAVPALCDEVERLRAALDLAATRLLSCSITMSGHYKESVDADWWHREARTAAKGGDNAG